MPELFDFELRSSMSAYATLQILNGTSYSEVSIVEKTVNRIPNKVYMHITKQDARKLADELNRWAYS